MTSIVNIQIGNGDNMICVKTTPTFRLELKTEIQPHLKSYCMNWNAFYYVNEMKFPQGNLHPLIEIVHECMPLKECKLNSYHILKKFIQSMENDKSCEYKRIKWNENDKLWTHRMLNSKRKLCIHLCDDAKRQFIQELKGMLYVKRSIYTKENGIHPSLLIRKRLAEL